MAGCSFSVSDKLQVTLNNRYIFMQSCRQTLTIRQLLFQATYIVQDEFIRVRLWEKLEVVVHGLPILCQQIFMSTVSPYGTVTHTCPLCHRKCICTCSLDNDIWFTEFYSCKSRNIHIAWHMRRAIVTFKDGSFSNELQNTQIRLMGNSLIPRKLLINPHWRFERN